MALVSPWQVGSRSLSTVLWATARTSSPRTRQAPKGPPSMARCPRASAMARRMKTGFGLKESDDTGVPQFDRGLLPGGENPPKGFRGYYRGNGWRGQPWGRRFLQPEA